MDTATSERERETICAEIRTVRWALSSGQFSPDTRYVAVEEFTPCVKRQIFSLLFSFFFQMDKKRPALWKSDTLWPSSPWGWSLGELKCHLSPQREIVPFLCFWLTSFQVQIYWICKIFLQNCDFIPEIQF